MADNIHSQVFENQIEAERFVNELRQSGVPDDAISVIARHDGEIEAAHPDGRVTDHDADTTASGVTKGVVAGGTLGALFGLAAFFIPGVGPLITAGAFASTLGFAGGAAASGAIVGAAAGGLTGLLMKYGISQENAENYEHRLNQGGVVVMVDSSKAPNAPGLHQKFGTHQVASRMP